MATVSIVQKTKLLGAYVVIADVTMSNSYTTGGESVTPAQIGLQTVTMANTSFANGHVYQYDRVNKKVQAFGGAAAGAALQEMAAATNLSGDTVRIEFIGN